MSIASRRRRSRFISFSWTHFEPLFIYNSLTRFSLYFTWFIWSLVYLLLFIHFVCCKLPPPPQPCFAFVSPPVRICGHVRSSINISSSSSSIIIILFPFTVICFISLGIVGYLFEIDTVCTSTRSRAQLSCCVAYPLFLGRTACKASISKLRNRNALSRCVP